MAMSIGLRWLLDGAEIDARVLLVESTRAAETQLEPELRRAAAELNRPQARRSEVVPAA